MMEEVWECLIVNQEIPKFQICKLKKQARFWSGQSQKGNSCETSEQEKQIRQTGERELRKP